jgi:hypothetical protein
MLPKRSQSVLFAPGIGFKSVLETPANFPSGRWLPWSPWSRPHNLVNRFNVGCRKGHVVKAFNTVRPVIMTHPETVGGADMFIAGEHDAAKTQVSTLLEAFGWKVRDLGGIEASRWLEALVMVGISYAMKHGVQHNAFQIKTA